MSKITTYADIVKLRKAGKLTTAEKTLIRNCKAGEETVLGDGSLPDVAGDANEVQAGLLRYLIAGGCGKCKVHDWGVLLGGAYISGELDLSFITAKGATGLINCRFEEGVMALQARFRFLNLTGSHLPGLNAQGATVTGGVFLQGGFKAEGEVSLSGAQIGGQLSCIKGHFNNAGGFALNAQGATVTGGVFLQGGFKAEGEVSLSGAQIGGQLDCTKGHFNNADGDALNAQKLVAAALLWREVAEVSGGVYLSGAKIGDLSDDAKSWDLVDELYLNGFEYAQIHGPVDANIRFEWVAKGSCENADFMPQPYEQLARVLRRMGHVAGAREVLFEKEKRLKQVARGRIWGQGHRVLRWGHVPVHWGLDRLQRVVVGYGYYPWRSFWCLVGLIAIAAYVFDSTYEAGDFAPNAAVILTTPEWQALAEDGSVSNPAETWSSESRKGRDYETFNAIAYAADVVIPIIPLGQEAAWAPSATRGKWGNRAWWLRWVFQFAGWVVAALGAAAITGIMRKE